MKLVYEDFKEQFGCWAEDFRPFIESEDMWNIYQTLKEDGKKSIIVPDCNSTFRSFLLTDPSKVKVVWYLMDPYARRYKNKANQATGVAMSCSNSPDGVLQPSLNLFYNGLIKDVGEDIEKSPDIEYLLEQGVMLLNTDLTCKLNKTGSHEKLWEPFQKFFLEEIMSKKTGIIYVMAGKVSERMEKYISPLGNYLYKVEHPAAAAHKNTEWNCKGIFKNIEKLLRESNREPVIWDKSKYIVDDDCPF